MEDNEFQIDTPLEDLIIEIEWAGMVESSKNYKADRNKRETRRDKRNER